MSQQLQIPPELMAQALSFIVMIKELHEEGDIIEILKSNPYFDQYISMIELSAGKSIHQIIDELYGINDFGELLITGMRYLIKPFMSESAWAEMEKRIGPVAKQLHYVKSPRLAAVIVFTNLFGLSRSMAESLVSAVMPKKEKYINK